MESLSYRRWWRAVLMGIGLTGCIGAEALGSDRLESLQDSSSTYEPFSSVLTDLTISDSWTEVYELETYLFDSLMSDLNDRMTFVLQSADEYRQLEAFLQDAVTVTVADTRHDALTSGQALIAFRERASNAIFAVQCTLQMRYWRWRHAVLRDLDRIVFGTASDLPGFPLSVSGAQRLVREMEVHMDQSVSRACDRTRSDLNAFLSAAQDTLLAEIRPQDSATTPLMPTSLAIITISADDSYPMASKEMNFAVIDRDDEIHQDDEAAMMIAETGHAPEANLSVSNERGSLTASVSNGDALDERVVPTAPSLDPNQIAVTDAADTDPLPRPSVGDPRQPTSPEQAHTANHRGIPSDGNEGTMPLASTTGLDPAFPSPSDLAEAVSDPSSPVTGQSDPIPISGRVRHLSKRQRLRKKHGPSPSDVSTASRSETTGTESAPIPSRSASAMNPSPNVTSALKGSGGLLSQMAAPLIVRPSFVLQPMPTMDAVPDADPDAWFAFQQDLVAVRLRNDLAEAGLVLAAGRLGCAEKATLGAPTLSDALVLSLQQLSVGVESFFRDDLQQFRLAAAALEQAAAQQQPDVVVARLHRLYEQHVNQMQARLDLILQVMDVVDDVFVQSESLVRAVPLPEPVAPVDQPYLKSCFFQEMASCAQVHDDHREQMQSRYQEGVEALRSPAPLQPIAGAEADLRLALQPDDRPLLRLADAVTKYEQVYLEADIEAAMTKVFPRPVRRLAQQGWSTKLSSAIQESLRLLLIEGMASLLSESQSRMAQLVRDFYDEYHRRLALADTLESEADAFRIRSVASTAAHIVQGAVVAIVDRWRRAAQTFIEHQLSETCVGIDAKRRVEWLLAPLTWWYSIHHSMIRKSFTIIQQNRANDDELEVAQVVFYEDDKLVVTICHGNDSP